MASDVRIKNEDGQFKFRVCGIVKVGERYLTVKISSNKFYCLPGGHVELGEDTDQAIQREMKEELGYEIKITKLASIIQNFFKTPEGKTFHELGYYYIVEPKNINEVNLENYERIENDKGELKKLEFKWFTLDELKEVDFRPIKLINELQSNNLKNIISRDREK